MTAVPHLSDNVVLLDEQGRPIGSANRVAVHTTDTALHLAFSTYLFNGAGELLLARRALSKKTWPGVWTNSCCGHPRPGEDIAVAARRRVREELGLTVGPLVPVLPEFRYRATDASGIVENEICPVFAGFVVDDVPTCDPDEVAETAWVPWSSFVAGVNAVPQVYSPWSVLQVKALGAHLPRLMRPFPAALPDVAGAMSDVDDLLRAELGQLSDVWAEFCGGMDADVLPDDLPGWLHSLLIGRGKRLRVQMTYWGFISAGGRPNTPDYHHMVRAAAALEMLHLFALIHDDVMDESDSRRGEPSAHVSAEAWHRDADAVGDPVVFGRNLALLLGDLAHTAADKMIDPLPRRLRSVWYDLCVELIAGQRADLTGAAAGRRDHAHAAHIARLKSGAYTIERPLQLGATAASASDEVLEVLADYGRHVGQAFAWRDDQLGVWGDPAQTGKPAGDDLLEAKATIIVALAERRLTGEDASRLRRMGTPHFGPDDADALARAMAAAGVADELEELIRREHDAAVASLDEGHLVRGGIVGLEAAAAAICWRNA